MEFRDENGNICTSEYFGTGALAKAALASLSNCSNCSNCNNCSNCSNCNNCSNCKDCSYCSYCSYCSNCRDCSYCNNCSNCSYCSNCSIAGLTRSDGYTFYINIDGQICAGCRYFNTFAEARKHWTETRAGTKLGFESLAALDALEQALKLSKK